MIEEGVQIPKSELVELRRMILEGLEAKVVFRGTSEDDVEEMQGEAISIKDLSLTRALDFLDNKFGITFTKKLG